MIKKAFLMAALLAPSLAYGGSTSNTLPAPQVTPAGSGISCDIGPNYTGSIPAGAQAAGFTHCAANYDFAHTAPFTDSVGTHQWSNIQSWLTSGNNSTCVSSTPLMWIVNYGGNLYAPCSDFAIVDDTAHGGASQVLKVAYKVGDIHAATHFATASNFGLPNPPGVFPRAGYYAEEMLRLDASYTGNTSCPPNGTQACLYFDFWSFPGNTSQNLEFDFIEAYAQQGPPNNSPPFAAGGQQYGGGQKWVNPGSLTASQLEGYNTFGALLTVTNGGSPNYAACYYLNGTKENCKAITAAAGDITNGRQAFLNTVGPQYQPGGSPACQPNCVTVQQDNITYIQRLTVWTCGNSGPCYSASLTQ
jgi:hypothetical protein